MVNILTSSSNLDLEQVERSLPPKARTSRHNGHARVYLGSGATDLTREVDLGEGPSSRKAPKLSISTQIDASNTHIERSPIAAVGIETSGTTAKSGTTSGFLHQQLSRNNVSRSKVFRSSRRVADWVHNASKAASRNNDRQEDIEGLLNQLISSLQASSAKMDELEQTSGSQLERWVELENSINTECRNSVRSIHALALKSDEHPASGDAPRSSLKRPYSRTSSSSDEEDDDEDRPSGSGRGASNKRPCLATIYVRPSFPHSPGQQPTNSTPPPAPSPPHTPRPRETANPLTSTSPRTPPPSHDHRTPAFVTSFLDTVLQSPQHPVPPPATSPPQALPAAPHSPSYTPPSPSRLRSPVPVPSPSTPILNRRHRPLSPPPSIPTPPIVDHRYRPASPYHDYSHFPQHRDNLDYHPRSPSRLSPRYTPEYERDPVVDENHYGRYSESHNPDHRDDEQRYRSRSRSPRRQTTETYPSTYPPRHDSPPTHPHPSTYHSSRGYSPLHLVYPPSHSSPRRESPQRLTPAPAQEEYRETQTAYKRSPSPPHPHHHHSYRNRTSEWVNSQGQYRDPSRDPPHTEHSESYPDTETRERDSRLSTWDDRHRSFDSAHHRRSSSRSQLRADDAPYSHLTHSQDRDYDYRRSENWTQPPNDHTQPYPTHSHDRYYDHPDHTWHSNLPPLRRRYDDAVYQDENERAYPNTMDRRYDDAPSHHSNSYDYSRHDEASPSRPSRESHYRQWDERDGRDAAYEDTRASRIRPDYSQDASHEAQTPYQYYPAPQSNYDYPRSTYRAPEQRHQEPSALPSHHRDYDYSRSLWPEQAALSPSHHRSHDHPRSLYPDPEQRTSSSSHHEHRDYPTRDRDTSHYRDEGRSWHWENTRSRDAETGDRDTLADYQRHVDQSDSISQNRYREPQHDRDDLEGRSYPREREREPTRDTRARYRTTPFPYSRSRTRPESASVSELGSASASVIHAPRPRRKIKIEAMQLLALEAEANEEAFDEDEDEDGVNAAEDRANEGDNGVNEAESTEETVVHAEANEKEEEEEEGSESGSEYSLRVYE